MTCRRLNKCDLMEILLTARVTERRRAAICPHDGGNPRAPIGGEASVFFNCSLDTLSLCLSIGLWMQLLRLCVRSRLKVSGNGSVAFHRRFGTEMSPWLITHNPSCPRKGLYWFTGLNVCVWVLEGNRAEVRFSLLEGWTDFVEDCGCFWWAVAFFWVFTAAGVGLD